MKLKLAQTKAQEIISILNPGCDIILIAGSVRREVQEVNDIEIVCRPKPHTDLFGDSNARHPLFIDAIKSLKVIKGNPYSGRYIEVDYDNIQVDIFVPQKDDFYRQYAIRTGSADYAHNTIARTWTNKGWVGTKQGLRLATECYFNWVSDKKVWHPMDESKSIKPPAWKSEGEFFEWLGVEYKDPILR